MTQRFFNVTGWYASGSLQVKQKFVNEQPEGV